MFAAMVEAALLEFGEPTLPERLEDCVRNMLGWYVGDGVYGDGEFFHFDYYNSFVIQPMLLDVLAVLKKHDADFAPAHAVVLKRARRLCGNPGAAHRAGRNLSLDRPLDDVSLRRVSNAGANCLAARTAGNNQAGASALRADGGHPQNDGSAGNL